MIYAYENDRRFKGVIKSSNLEALKDFQDKMEKKIEKMAKAFKISPTLQDKFEIAIINISSLMTIHGKEIFETKILKYKSDNRELINLNN